MLGNLQGWHFIILLVVILLIFGAPKLPGLARSIGQSMRIFRSEVKTMKDETKDGDQTPNSTDGNANTSSASAESTSETKPNS